MSKAKKNRMSTSIIWLIIILIVLIYVVYNIINLLIEPTEIFLVKKDTLSEEESAVGYIIREESVIPNDSGDKEILPIKVEGEKVAKGDIVYRYSYSNEENLNKQIEELNIQIQDALEKQTDLFSNDIKALNSQIDSKIENLKYENNIQKIIEYKKDIDTYINKKVNIIGESSNSGSYIKELIAQKANIEKQLELETKFETASVSGVVSYRIDNLEEVLSPKDFTTINEKVLEGLKIKTGQIINTSNNQCKIVNNYNCYIATITESKNAKNAKVGDSITIRLSTREKNQIDDFIYFK